MATITEFEFPDELQYIFIDPISFFWVKRQLNPANTENQSLLLGFPEIITKNFNKDQLKFDFRSETLYLRENKPFLRLLTKNKLFEFVAPWKSQWQINPEIKNNLFTFLDQPYDQYIIKCSNFEDESKITQVLRPITELEDKIRLLLEKDMFSDCKDCPDLFQGSIKRRSNGFR